jgi:uncharacterized membrane protein
MNSEYWAQWRANFLTGLAVVMPAVVSFAVVIWLFGTVANFTETLLFFLPRELTNKNQGTGPMHWYWSLVALLLAILLVSLAGRLTRHYLGKRLIVWVDTTLLRVPLLNKIYGTVKQVNEAFSSNQKSAFRQVVLLEFPHRGHYAVGFITADQDRVLQPKTAEKMVSVFIPTTPNPTSGFLILAPEDSVQKLDLSVADGIKYIISLGAVAPDPSAPGAPGSRQAR